MKQIVYILTNEAMPGYVKIGKTTNIKRRLKELYKTAVPLPFECYYAREVDDYSKVESGIHDAFADRRVSSQREFFEVAPERVLAVLKLIGGKDVTPKNDYIENKEDKIALDKAKKRAEAFNFKFVDIPPGEKLTFIRDDNITCTILDEKFVEHNGERKSLTRAVKDILEDERPVQGPRFWVYEGELLTERRRRLEES